MALKINGIRVAGAGSDGKDGVGVPFGGSVGQILVKKTVADYDTEWTDLPSIDPTLSVEGQAADAKIVGDQIHNLSTIIGDGFEDITSNEIQALFG